MLLKQLPAVHKPSFGAWKLATAILENVDTYLKFDDKVRVDLDPNNLMFAQ